MIKKLIKLLLIILCMFMIFSFSSDNGVESTKKSDSIIITITEKFIGRELTIDEKEKYIDIFVVPVRKSGHLFIYFLLGLSIISFLSEFMIINKKGVIITIIIVFLYACSDEIHQLFISGRSGEVLDVLIDTIGGSISAYLYYYIIKLRRKCHGQKETIS